MGQVQRRSDLKSTQIQKFERVEMTPRIQEPLQVFIKMQSYLLGGELEEKVQPITSQERAQGEGACKHNFCILLLA